MGKTFIFSCVFIIIALTSFPVFSATLDDCSSYLKNPLYAKTIDFYSYRIKEQISKYGCGAISVYHAFNNENGALLELAENDAAFMRSLIEALGSNRHLTDILASHPRLTQALDNILLDESGRESFLQRLKQLNANQLAALVNQNPAIVAIAFLIPHISPKIIAKNMSRKESEALLALIDSRAVTAAAGEATGMENLLPYISTNPTDALEIYKQVVKTWGVSGIEKIFNKTPDTLNVIVPPLELSEFQDLPIKPSIGQFREMQKRYIAIMRDLYKETQDKYSAAWADAVCQAFADSLALALLAATPEESVRIRNFLLSIVDNRQMFRKLFLPAACPPDASNLKLFAETINRSGLLNLKARGQTAPLTALANWQAEGRLGHILEDWLQYTNAEKLNAHLKNYLLDKRGNDDMHDGIFLAQLTALAMDRSMLDPRQKDILDDLTNELARKQKHPATVMAFLHHVHEPLFSVLQNDKWLHPAEVARHLVATGYPESSNSSLFEYFQDNEAMGFMPYAEEAIKKRGALPEGTLLEHGITFADKHGGHSVMDMVEGVQIATSIGFGIAATVSTAGAAGPVVEVLIAKMGAKQAARQIARQVMKNLGKKAVNLSGIAKKLLRNPVKTTKAIASRPGEPIKRTIGRLDNAYDIADGVSSARKIYLALTVGAGLSAHDFDIGSQQETLCPQNQENQGAIQ